MKKKARQNTIGARLGDARRELRLSLAEFISITGIPESTLKKYESGHIKPGAEAFQLIAKANINTHWLITGEGEMLLYGPPVSESELKADERQLLKWYRQIKPGDRELAETLVKGLAERRPQRKREVG